MFLSYHLKGKLNYLCSLKTMNFKEIRHLFHLETQMHTSPLESKT